MHTNYLRCSVVFLLLYTTAYFICLLNYHTNIRLSLAPLSFRNSILTKLSNEYNGGAYLTPPPPTLTVGLSDNGINGINPHFIRNTVLSLVYRLGNKVYDNKATNMIELLKYFLNILMLFIANCSLELLQLIKFFTYFGFCFIIIE